MSLYQAVAFMQRTTHAEMLRIVQVQIQTAIIQATAMLRIHLARILAIVRKKRGNYMIFKKKVVSEALNDFCLYEENTNCPCKVVNICPITNNGC